MSSLENVYCLGCKERHTTVEVETVKRLLVKGSARYQGRGVCSNGKKWTKLLNKGERTILKSLMPDVDKEVIVSSQPVVEEPVVEEPVVEEPVVEEPVVEPLQGVMEETTEITEIEVSPQEVVVQQVVDSSPATQVDASEVLDRVMEPNHSNHIEKEAVALHRDMRSLNTNRRAQTPQSKQSTIKAVRVGRHLGYSVAAKTGYRYDSYMRKQFDKSGLALKYFDTFADAYMRAGEEYLRSLNEEYVETKEQDLPIVTEQKDEGLSTPAVAGLAAVSIFGAWMAAKFNQR